MANIPEYNLDLVHADPQITAEQALENSRQRVTAAANEARQTPRRSGTPKSNSPTTRRTPTMPRRSY